MKKLSFHFFMGICFLLFVPPSYAQSLVLLEGIVTDDQSNPVEDATITILGTNYGTITNALGEYQLQVSGLKEATLIAYHPGFSTKDLSIILDNDVVAVDFSLEIDLLGLDEVVVTGTKNDKTKLQSSVAISTLSPASIQSSGARNFADALKNMPGFYVESSGGDGNANIFARGLPTTGGMRHVQLQEDGLPVFEYGDLMFGNTDIWMRIDRSIDRIEGVRGGSASVYVSNAPGGIINMISKTGSFKQVEGEVAFTTGLSYGHIRTDFEVGGPINEGLRFHVGGFFRSGNGLRSTGFTASNGGQLKFNLTKTFDRGYVRMYGKYLNDRSAGILPIPLQGDPAEGIPGFDPYSSTLQSVDLLNLSVQTPFGREVRERLDVGMNPRVSAVGGEAFFEIGEGLTLKDNFRKSYLNGQFNAIFGISNPTSAQAYAESRGLTDYTYSYAQGFRAGEPLNMNGLNGNGLVAEYGWWAVDIPLEQFANKLEITKDFGLLTLTGEYYYNQNIVSAQWWWHNMLVDISSNTRRLNLVDNLADSTLTSNGFTQYGTLYRDYYANTQIHAPSLTMEWNPTDRVNVEAGLRVDVGSISGWTENTGSYDYDVDRDGNISPAEMGVTYGNTQQIPFSYDYDAFSWSLGANFEVNANQAVFARASNGHRAPADRTYAFNATTQTRDGFPENTVIENIFQYELGYKLKSNQLAIFATGFYSVFKDVLYTDLLADGTAIAATYNTVASGVEAEVVFQAKGLRLALSGTYQDLQYKDWIQNVDTDGDRIPDTQLNFDGNQIQRIPELYFSFKPEYRLYDAFHVGAVIQYFGDRFTTPANDQMLPAFTQINLNAGVQVAPNLTWEATISNLTNSLGLTEGNPRSGLLSSQDPYFYARPIFGRSAITTLSYKF